MADPDRPTPQSEHALTAVEAWFDHRLEHAPQRISASELAAHRHCADCGLPVTAYLPGGMVFDLGTSEEHICPPDFGREVRCLCGVTVRESITGRVTEISTGRAHDCEWTADLGHRFALMPSPAIDKLMARRAREQRQDAQNVRQAVEIPD